MAQADLIADRYRRRQSLGRGAMGEVWLAEDTLLGRSVAIKTFHLEGLGRDGDSAAVDRFLREAQVAARLRHPHAVAIYDLISPDGVPHIVMEFVEGESLAARLRRVGHLTVDTAARLIGQIAGALEAAHGLGVVHRDVKPANILLDNRGDARLADFGIARGLADASVTNAGEIVGTVAFMAPEVANGAPSAFASDVWSLGATLYVAVEGRVPHAPPDQTSDRLNTTQLLVRRVTEAVVPAVNAGALSELLAQMLAADPGARPSAAEVARRAIDVAVRGQSAVSPAAPPAPPVPAAPAPIGVEPQPAPRRGSRLLQFLQNAWTCPSCGADAMPSEEFCRRCGGRVSRPTVPAASHPQPRVPTAPQLCPQCATPTMSGSRFCGACGGSLAP